MHCSTDTCPNPYWRAARTISSISSWLDLVRTQERSIILAISAAVNFITHTRLKMPTVRTEHSCNCVHGIELPGCSCSLILACLIFLEPWMQPGLAGQITRGAGRNA